MKNNIQSRLAINGMGRIGRQTFRAFFQNNYHHRLKLIAINDLMNIKTLIHLLKYDSIYGKFPLEIKEITDGIVVDNQEIKVFQLADPSNLPWGKLGVETVLECTGFFTEYQGARKHIDAGAKRVIISAPSKSEEIRTFVLGVNHTEFNCYKDKIISMGSCTTNCLAPIAKVLDDNFKIQQGFMTTAHSYTNDQRILDLDHRDLRRARAAAINIIPTTTGAAQAIGRVLPQLQGKLDGIALRIPTAIVSILDLICSVEKRTTANEVISAFEKAAKNKNLENILKLEKQPLVSCDYIGDNYSAIVDQDLIMVKDNLIKVTAWYDNEWAYSCRLVELAEYIK
jgi:glyceraldehyde 3-phosphate dehydrogenase